MYRYVGIGLHHLESGWIGGSRTRSYHALFAIVVFRDREFEGSKRAYRYPSGNSESDRRTFSFWLKSLEKRSSNPDS